MPNNCIQLERFNIGISIFVSLVTVFIGWKTFQLNDIAGENNIQLKQIESRLAQKKFGFERIKDIYDRTEKYLNSEQDERRGRALVALINSLPEIKIKEDLLSIVTVETTQDAVRIAAATSYVGSSLSKVAKNGSYFGTLYVEMLNDGKSIKTISKFGFKDSNGKTWSVPAGSISDGASIPSSLWPAVGSPFSGKYRDASIVHDYYSSQMSRPWKDVHKMFYEAMIASGVDETKAKILYTAVYSFGPRWDIHKNDENSK